MGQQCLLLPLGEMLECRRDRRALLFFEQSLIGSVGVVHPDHTVLVTPLGLPRSPHRGDHVSCCRDGVWLEHARLDAIRSSQDLDDRLLDQILSSRFIPDSGENNPPQHR